jgi:hypothetical protein
MLQGYIPNTGANPGGYALIGFRHCAEVTGLERNGITGIYALEHYRGLSELTDKRTLQVVEITYLSIYQQYLCNYCWGIEGEYASTVFLGFEM